MQSLGFALQDFQRKETSKRRRRMREEKKRTEDVIFSLLTNVVVSWTDFASKCGGQLDFSCGCSQLVAMAWVI